MQKSLTFKRKVYEVEAIQYKGEENADAVLTLLYKHHEYDPERFLKAVAVGEWIVFDPQEWPGTCQYSTEAFARKYEGI